MDTTNTGGVITLTTTGLDPYGTHTETRHLRAGPGLSPPGAPPWFGTLRGRPALRRVAELVAEAGKLAAVLREQLVMGALRTVDRDLQSLVLDGTTGAVPTYVHPCNPGLMDFSPLAPSLAPLLRCASHARLRRGEHSARAEAAGRPASQAVAEVSRWLASVFGAEAAQDSLPYRRMAALLRPMARIARPAEGLALALPPRLLDEEFGSAAVVHFEDIDFPAALTHEPTRRFLRDTGLPEHGYWYELDTDVPLPTLTEYYTDEDVFTADELPEGADRLIRLGHLLEDTSLLVDGTSGALLCWSEPESLLRPLHADLSTLAFTVWLVHREKTLDTDNALTEAYEHLTATAPTTIDPLYA
ncbi:SUKH-4 family immunity protein [Streptomyces sp. SID2888]|uniref:SUKH-4 family immunity protein n=1 Tax=Streptomyces sp. SID2888 TaxID=2690256 RepID=UPI00136EBF74|nr:SUKH-4 family immunity protein [Streptomyces sp. SID2888]MYV44751.1 hypothetical protein [Streptomyces sp. SID2888]